MYILVLVTAKDKRQARKIAKILIRNRLAACVNILGKVESFFLWQGKVDSASEALLIIKSKKIKMPKIIRLVKSLHSYDLPEIISLPITSGFKPYLNWINESC
ncbi:MAG: divalent-cation tolerance protein CutA [Candidatus Omnitrophica bacterium]|nr:divalent-cation tolerance protein CutA [Candidatus Omnitrophota bacterium]